MMRDTRSLLRPSPESFTIVVLNWLLETIGIGVVMFVILLLVGAVIAGVWFTYPFSVIVLVSFFVLGLIGKAIQHRRILWVKLEKN